MLSLGHLKNKNKIKLRGDTNLIELNIVFP